MAERNSEERIGDGQPSIAGVTAETGKCGRWEFVRYTGTREALISAGVATAEMFPIEGRNRRYNTGPHVNYSPTYFSTSRIGELFSIKRWRRWNDLEAVRAIEAENDDPIAAYNASIAQIAALHLHKAAAGLDKLLLNDDRYNQRAGQWKHWLEELARTMESPLADLKPRGNVIDFGPRVSRVVTGL